MMLRYRAIAQQIAELIEQGTFAPGQRIPSVRALSAKMRTSPATVFSAYGELEQRGLIRARPQSGFYVEGLLHKLAPLPVQETVRERPVAITTEGVIPALLEQGQGSDVVALDAATPSTELVPHVALARALAAAARRHPGPASAYCYPPGHVALRRAIVLRALDAGIRTVADDVVITTGATDALHLCLRAVTRPGDAVAVESPTYYGMLQTLETLGLRAIEVATDPQTGIRLDHLRRVLGKHRIAACFVMPCYSNPTGLEMADAAKTELVDLLERAGVPLIEDDVNGELHFGRRRPRAAKAFDRAGNVMLCSSVSKTLAPGYRIGWTLPGRWRDRVIARQWSTTISASTPAQLAVAEFLRSGGYDRHLRRLRTAIQYTMQRSAPVIARNFPEGTSVTRPRGGLVLWVKLPGLVDSRVLQHRALALRISIMPGELFAMHGTYRSYVRLNCGAPYTAATEAALVRLGALAGELRQPRARSSSR